MHYTVPVNNCVLDIDYAFLQEGFQTSASECYVKLKDGAEVRQTWQVVTKEEFNTVKESMMPPE